MLVPNSNIYAWILEIGVTDKWVSINFFEQQNSTWIIAKTNSKFDKKTQISKFIFNFKLFSFHEISRMNIIGFQQILFSKKIETIHLFIYNQ